MPDPSAPITREERRRSPRRPHEMSAWIASPTAKDAGERIEVKSIDLSRHGVAFNVPAPLPVRAYYIIKIGIGEQTLTCEIRTINCRQLGSGMYHIGAEFA